MVILFILFLLFQSFYRKYISCLKDVSFLMTVVHPAGRVDGLMFKAGLALYC